MSKIEMLQQRSLSGLRGSLLVALQAYRATTHVDISTTVAQAKYGKITFQKLTAPDLSILVEWLNRPHVAEWWDACESLEEVREKYLPRMRDESTVVPYLAYLDSTPIGYIQSYVAAATSDGWWPNEHDPEVRGIDQFLADEQHLGQGLGTHMVKDFVQFLFRDPKVTKIQADPALTNARAIRCYEKAGFRRVGPITTPDGPAMLMVIDCVRVPDETYSQGANRP
jgi:aminoglycoside 6'-N-acetyltransferase-1b